MTKASFFARIGSAFFFGLMSISVVFVNKILLTNLRFPSFLYLALGQMVATILVLFISERCQIISFPRFERSIPRRIFPLPIFYLLNLISGLGGTQKLNLPMFTVLRRVSILLTMIFEYFLLGVQFPFAIKVSVFLMIFGSFIAALYDLAFDSYGYTLIMINNVFTAANVVYTKKKLDSKDLGQYGLLYYNSLLMILPAMLIAFLSDDFEKVKSFMTSTNFTTSVWICFIISSLCGFLLNYSSVLCTHYNSPLTTTCVGPIKNLFVTYVGMISSGDYIFSWANFVGVNISVFGSVLYTYVTFRRKSFSQNRQITVNPIEKEKLIS